jgi:4-hydroxybenzoate polyprenyltransferase
MRAAGCAFNDIVDRDIDAQVARTALRPIPSGRISVKQAWTFVIGCSLASLLILLTLNIFAILLGVASLLLVAAYPFMKRITWWPQAWLGLTFNWGALMGFAAAAMGAVLVGFPILQGQGATYIAILAPPLAPALLLYLALVFWTLGYDTIYALQDIEDDAMVGVKSSARRLGSRVASGVFAFYLLAFVLVAWAGVLAGLQLGFWLGLAVWASHLFGQVRDLRPDDPALALRLFRSNRDAGFILLSAIILGAVSWPF